MTDCCDVDADDNRFCLGAKNNCFDGDDESALIFLLEMLLAAEEEEGFFGDGEVAGGMAEDKDRRCCCACSGCCSVCSGCCGSCRNVFNDGGSCKTQAGGSSSSSSSSIRATTTELIIELGVVPAFVASTGVPCNGVEIAAAVVAVWNGDDD